MYLTEEQIIQKREYVAKYKGSYKDKFNKEYYDNYRFTNKKLQDKLTNLEEEMKSIRDILKTIGGAS
jgi:hypothetical protein